MRMFVLQNTEQISKLTLVKSSEPCKIFNLFVGIKFESGTSKRNVHANSELWRASFQRVEIEKTKML